MEEGLRGDEGYKKCERGKIRSEGEKQERRGRRKKGRKQTRGNKKKTGHTLHPIPERWLRLSSEREKKWKRKGGGTHR